LAALLQLQALLEARMARVAWSQLRREMAEVVPGARLDVVVDLRLGQIRLAQSDVELAEAVRVRNPIQVIELGPRLQEIGDAFRRWAEVAPFRPSRRGRVREKRSA
jgi:hypothetical protein